MRLSACIAIRRLCLPCKIHVGNEYCKSLWGALKLLASIFFIAVELLWFLAKICGSWPKLHGDFCNLTVSAERSATQNAQSVRTDALKVTLASL